MGVLPVASVVFAATSTVNVTVTAGSLQQTTGPFQAPAATPADQTLTTTPAAPWTATDGRGTCAPRRRHRSSPSG